jgi:hypothetical protein
MLSFSEKVDEKRSEESEETMVDFNKYQKKGRNIRK